MRATAFCGCYWQLPLAQHSEEQIETEEWELLQKMVLCGCYCHAWPGCRHGGSAVGGGKLESVEQILPVAVPVDCGWWMVCVVPWQQV